MVWLKVLVFITPIIDGDGLTSRKKQSVLVTSKMARNVPGVLNNVQ